MQAFNQKKISLNWSFTRRIGDISVNDLIIQYEHLHSEGMRAIPYLIRAYPE